MFGWFKRKKRSGEVGDTDYAHWMFNGSSGTEEPKEEKVPEPIHAKCAVCGKTDFKDNMEVVRRAELYRDNFWVTVTYDTVTGIRSFEDDDTFCETYKSRVVTEYHHPECKKPAKKKKASKRR